jgi:adenylate cyclase
LSNYPTGTVTFLFTDVVRSSRLWEQNHDAMQAAMATHDRIVKESISANAGVFLKQTGDGAFAVFASAFDAVAAALAVQAALAEESWGELASFAVRIGLHTGEAELRDCDYFGPAVNRAARVMSIADGGQVLLSRPTQDVARDRLRAGVDLRDLGERELKGMARPEHVFELVTGEPADTAETTRRSGPDSSRDQTRRAAWIAVLPFENLSGDPDQEYFADGITEEVINTLARFRYLTVIARSSSFTYRDSNASMDEIADELGVRFVLEGSVRRADNRVRVTARLIDANGLQHVWANRYDAELGDIFDVQDEISSSIAVAIDPAIRIAATEGMTGFRPENLDAWHNVQRGLREYFRFKPEANREATRHFEAALVLDNDYAAAHAGPSQAHALSVWLRWTDDPAGAVETAWTEARRAIELDALDERAHFSLALVAYVMGRLDVALEAAERAVELNPSFAVAYMIGGVAKAHGGDPEGGVAMLDRAIALSPHDPTASWFHGGRALSNFLAGNCADAITDARAAIKLRYGYLMARVLLTASLAELGELEQAGEELDALLSIEPDFDPTFYDAYTFSNEADRERLTAGLRAAGLQTA